MRKHGISEETIAWFDFPETGGSEEVMALINQIDKLLSKEQYLTFQYRNFHVNAINFCPNPIGRHITGSLMLIMLFTLSKPPNAHSHQ